MCIFTIILTVDTNLGRVNYSSFSDQTLMEMLIGDLDDETKKKYQDSEKMYLDVCKWDCVKCDDDGNVIAINPKGDVKGSLQLSYIPPKVREFDASYKGLTGPADLAYLPQSLEELYLDNNKLAGSVDLGNLPQNMHTLYLDSNKLTGSIKLSNLPKNMQGLFLHCNAFSGSIELTNLPQSLLSLTFNSNELTGSFIATNLPPKLEKIEAGYNLFSATAVVDAKTKAMINLRESGVTSVIDENGNSKLRIWVRF